MKKRNKINVLGETFRFCPKRHALIYKCLCISKQAQTYINALHDCFLWKYIPENI